MERIVFELGSRLRKPNASSSARRPLAAASSFESLAVASATAGGVEMLRLAVALVEKRSWENLAVAFEDAQCIIQRAAASCRGEPFGELGGGFFHSCQGDACRLEANNVGFFLHLANLLEFNSRCHHQWSCRDHGPVVKKAV